MNAFLVWLGSSIALVIAYTLFEASIDPICAALSLACGIFLILLLPVLGVAAALGGGAIYAWRYGMAGSLLYPGLLIAIYIGAIVLWLQWATTGPVRQLMLAGLVIAAMAGSLGLVRWWIARRGVPGISA